MNRLTLIVLLSLCIFFQNNFCLAQCHPNDWSALKALYESTDGNNWINRFGWDVQIANENSPPSNCNLINLYGVRIDATGRVDCLDFDGNPNCTAGSFGGNNLTGVIPPELSSLLNLSYLNLASNKLSGSIPVELSYLSNLYDLRLDENSLSGNIPAELGNLNNLHYLSMALNDFTGSIPVELANLSNLRSLDMSYNLLLTGNIPPELGDLSNLMDLRLYDNDLIGSIPHELSSLSNLKVLVLDKNRLDGNIPKVLGSLSNLTTLNLSQNNLTGEIPDELGYLINLKFFYLAFNGLSGKIPAIFGDLSNLNYFDLRYNNLSGCYSSNLKNLCTQLVVQDISDGNNFVATWADFCATGIGECPPGEGVPTNYSGDVNISINNDSDILKNSIATVYDYSTCLNYTNISNCNPVVGFNNSSANEALWVVTKAAEYFSTYHDIEIPHINIIVNDIESPNGAIYKPSQNIIVLGKGDGIKRNAITAPDIVGHEYAHAVFNSLKLLGNYGISGALNESYADIFGELIERHCYGYNDDWVYGSQVMVDAVDNKNGLRNLFNPKDETMQYQLPNTYKGEHWINIDNSCFHKDNCGIHTNSGVHSYWFYLLAYGGAGINDNGYNYSLNGLGTNKAAEITIKNLTGNLNPSSTFRDARDGSIDVAKTDYGNEPGVFTAVKAAWDAVGITENNKNPILFRLTNASQVGTVTLENGKTNIPAQFDLSIDSLDLDISADELCFSLHLPNTYQNLTLKTVYEPLTIDEICITDTLAKVSLNDSINSIICINRENTGYTKKDKVYLKIPSRSSIIQFGVCIVIENVKSEPTTIIEPIDISGYTKTGIDEEISFKPATLPFGFDYNPFDQDPQNMLEISLTLNHKNCKTLGDIEAEILNKMIIGVSPYTYTLKNAMDSILDKSLSDSARYQFYNLEEGIYKLEVKDSNNKQIIKEFRVDFVAKQNESICCAENLIIPPGYIEGVFNASGTIDFSKGVLISEGIFEICK